MSGGGRDRASLLTSGESKPARVPKARRQFVAREQAAKIAVTVAATESQKKQ
jgi:hypothetical protein